MSSQFDSKAACWAAGALAAYFSFSAVTFLVGPGVIGFLSIPAIFMMLVPTPLLLKVGLAEQSWLISGPTLPGAMLLVLIYLAMAYFIGGYLGYHFRSGSRASD